jgi:sugar phosphate isomerase/epimerase
MVSLSPVPSGGALPSTPALTRRRFTQLLAVAATLPAMRARAAASNPAVPLIGVQTSVEHAPAVLAAGGSFIAESVTSFVRPDSSAQEFQETLARARRTPLPILACNYFIIGRPDLRSTGPDADHPAVLAYAERAFERAQRLGVRILTFGSSGSRSLPPDFPQSEGKDQFVALLKAMGPLARRHNITVAVESLQRRECNFLTRITEVGEVIRRVDHPNIRVAADLYHLVAEEETPEDLRNVLDVLAHLEIAELRGRRIPGTTDQDFRPFFHVLKTGGYPGAICFEGEFAPAELKPGIAAIARQWREA